MSSCASSPFPLLSSLLALTLIATTTASPLPISSSSPSAPSPISASVRRDLRTDQRLQRRWMDGGSGGASKQVGLQQQESWKAGSKSEESWDEEEGEGRWGSGQAGGGGSRKASSSSLVTWNATWAAPTTTTAAWSSSAPTLLWASLDDPRATHTSSSHFTSPPPPAAGTLAAWVATASPVAPSSTWVASPLPAAIAGSSSSAAAWSPYSPSSSHTPATPVLYASSSPAAIPYSSPSSVNPVSPPPASPPLPAPSSIPSVGSSSSALSDCALLDALFVTLGGSSWINTSGWAEAKEGEGRCCEYSGVTCDSEKRVTGLELSGKGLRGEVGEEVFGLEGLGKLNLSYNTLLGPLPDLFTSLPSLTHLSLTSNSLTGPLPASLLSSSSLISLHASNNSLTLPLSVSALSFPNAVQLETVSLAANLLTGGLEGLGGTANPNLRKIVLDGNRLSGELPDFGQFGAVMEVYSVRGNRLEGEVKGLENARGMVKLDISDNSLSGLFPDPSSLSSLTYFNPSLNPFSTPFPSTPSPPSLQPTGCVLPSPIPTSLCPSEKALADPYSLASVCGVVCEDVKPGKEEEAKVKGKKVKGLEEQVGWTGVGAAAAHAREWAFDEDDEDDWASDAAVKSSETGWAAVGGALAVLLFLV
ncbi:hypothetical protein JCM8547_006584 [Rhodosporidiobolus lusitaniae]